MSNTSSYFRSDSQLSDAFQALDFLTKRGFSYAQYSSSLLYSRKSGDTLEELSIKVVSFVAFRVDHSIIRRLKNRQVVKTKSVSGSLSTCIEYLESNFQAQETNDYGNTFTINTPAENYGHNPVPRVALPLN